MKYEYQHMLLSKQYLLVYKRPMLLTFWMFLVNEMIKFYVIKTLWWYGLKSFRPLLKELPRRCFFVLMSTNSKSKRGVCQIYLCWVDPAIFRPELFPVATLLYAILMACRDCAYKLIPSNILQGYTAFLWSYFL